LRGRIRAQFQQLAVTLRENNPTQGEKPSVSDKDTMSAMEALYDRLSPNVDAVGDLTVQLLLMKYTHGSRPYDPEEQASSMRLMSVQCIATDDPRLKGK
jgi:hypothetical protein